MEHPGINPFVFFQCAFLDVYTSSHIAAFAEKFVAVIMKICCVSRFNVEASNAAFSATLNVSYRHMIDLSMLHDAVLSGL